MPLSLSLPLPLSLFKVPLCSMLIRKSISFIWDVYISKDFEAFSFFNTYIGWITAKINDLGQVINGNILVVD